MKTLTAAFIASLTLALTACATPGSRSSGALAPASQESIALSVGPCFGFCPVYAVTVTADGSVTFVGKRNTQVVGRRMSTAQAGYATLAAALAPFRPATGSSARTKCDIEATDMSDTKIVWTARDGTRTALNHNLGCRAPNNDRLNAVLQRAPDMLGISGWTRQVTRPDTPRG